MRELFNREQKILDNALKHIGELRSGCGAPAGLEERRSKCAVCNNMVKTIVEEYGLLLKHLMKVVSISDKASGILQDDKKTKGEKITELENELLQNQISVMLSQIRPHFLYNSLVTIQELCLIDPEMASEAVREFSNYLRVNMDSLSIKHPVPFENELRHLETYLFLEKKRFGDKLNIVYDIFTRDCRR